MADSLQAIVRDMAITLATMNESFKQAERRSGAIESVHTAALLALIQSHPDRAALKQAWDEKISQLWAMSGSLGTDLLSEHMKQMQEILEEGMR